MSVHDGPEYAQAGLDGEGGPGDVHRDAGSTREADGEEVTDQLFPDAVRSTLPLLYSQEPLGEDAIVFVKFFTPDSSWTWFATEFDGDDVFFGLVVGMETELGYFSLAELRSARGPLGLSIERDEHFAPKTLAQVR